MSREQRLDRAAIDVEACAHERLFIILRRLRAARTIPDQELRDIRMAVPKRVLVQTPLRQPPIVRGRRVRVRAVREQPLGELHVAALVDGDPQQEPRARAVAAHVEHRPVRIVPIGLAARLHGLRVRQLEPPEHVAAEVRVVENLDVVRAGAAFEQEPVQRLALRMRRRVLLSLTGHAGQC